MHHSTFYTPDLYCDTVDIFLEEEGSEEFEEEGEDL